MKQPLKVAAMFLCLGILGCQKENGEEDQPDDLPGKPFSILNGGSQNDIYFSGTPAGDTGYIMAGSTGSTDGDFGNGSNPYDALVVKYDVTGKIAWFKRYIGNDDEQIHHILPTTDGGYLLTGYSNSTDGDFSGNKGSMDIWVMKTDARGNKVWSKTYGGSHHDFGHHALATTDGGYLITGYSYSDDGDAVGNHQAGKADGLVIRINGTGAIQWKKVLGGTESDFLYKAIATADGNYLLAGNTSSWDGDIANNHGDMDGWLVKLSSGGDLLFSNTYGALHPEGFRSLVRTADNGAILAGYIRSTTGPGAGNKGGADAWLLKVTATGDMAWSKTYGERDDEGLNDIIATPEGHFMATGQMFEDVSNIPDALLLAVDAGGNQRSIKKPGGREEDTGFGLFYAPREKKYVMAAASRSNDGDLKGNHGHADAWIYCFE